MHVTIVTKLLLTLDYMRGPVATSVGHIRGDVVRYRLWAGFGAQCAGLPYATNVFTQYA